MNSYIKDISYYVPEKIITNNDLEKLMDTSDEWITSRTGIKQRHSVGDNPLGPSDLAVESTKKLFDKIDVKLEDIDFVIFATSSPDTYVPGSGSIFQHKMGLNNIVYWILDKVVVVLSMLLALQISLLKLVHIKIF